MFVYKAGVMLGEYAQLCLECCTTQGLPTTVHVVQVWSEEGFKGGVGPLCNGHSLYKGGGGGGECYVLVIASVRE